MRIKKKHYRLEIITFPNYVIKYKNKLIMMNKQISLYLIIQILYLYYKFQKIVC